MSKDLAHRVGEDMRRLRSMLDRVLAGEKSGNARPLALSGEESRILDLACGACHEAEALSSFLADLRSDQGAGSKEGSRIRLTGVDLREREIADAQRRFAGKRVIESPGGGKVETEFEFFADDASRLDGHAELDDEFDLVFLRHQNYWNDRRAWEAIFERALDKTGPDGRLVITSYFDREHELALEAFRRLGGEVERTAFNPETRDLPTPGKSVDRHVAVIRQRTRP